MDSRVELEKRYKGARSNLLLMTAFSVVNIVLLILNTGVSFLFSATAPSVLVGVGLIFKEEPTLNALGGVCFALGFVIIGIYGLFYWLSKKYKVFMLVSLIFFAIDTLLLLWVLSLGFEASVLIDIAFHVWVLLSLGRGVWAWTHLMDLPDVPPAAAAPASIYGETGPGEPPAAF